MQRFLCLRKVTLQNSRSKSILHETTPKNGMQMVALNHIKRIIFVPPHHMMVEYIGDDKPIKFSNISKEVYKTITDEIRQDAAVITYDHTEASIDIDKPDVPFLAISPERDYTYNLKRDFRRSDSE